MSLLAGLLAPLGIGGAIWRWAIVPAAFLAALTLGKLAWDKRDARILAEGERICTARWEAAIREEERSAATRAVWAERQLLEAERITSQGLEHDLDRIRGELADARRKSTAAAGDNCLSPGVLESLRSGDAKRDAKGGAARR